jgi:D-alanyl-D-alanine carboxypeptidase
MSKNIKIFLPCLILSVFFWWGINILEKGLEDFFYTRELEKNPLILTAQISSFIFPDIQKPIINQEIPDLKISAKSAISVFVDSQGKDLILFQKNESEKLPIASLTKLMTALVVLDIHQLSDEVKISKEAVEQEGEEIELKVGEILSVRELLEIMLIASSNDAAYALATPNVERERMGEESFVDLMNLEAYYNIGLKPENTHFINPTGLDPKDPFQDTNYSTVKDLVELVKYLIKYQPEILGILSQKESGTFNNTSSFLLENTNKLLGEIEGIVGGKTGYTKRAGGCLVLILEGPRKNSYFINVILSSEDRFEEMKQLINWTKESFSWR